MTTDWFAVFNTPQPLSRIPLQQLRWENGKHNEEKQFSDVYVDDGAMYRLTHGFQGGTGYIVYYTARDIFRG